MLTLWRLVWDDQSVTDVTPTIYSAINALADLVHADEATLGVLIDLYDEIAADAEIEAEVDYNRDIGNGLRAIRRASIYYHARTDSSEV